MKESFAIVVELYLIMNCTDKGNVNASPICQAIEPSTSRSESFSESP